MTTLTNFFKESDSTLGVFYPKHYIIATFPTFEGAQQAAQALRRAGFGEGDMVAIPGAEILQFFDEFRAHSSLWAGVMSVLSRAFGTEQTFADVDVQRAQAGAGFLAIYSPEEGEASRIRALVEPFKPKAMHWYLAGGVECLI
jgi:hypothetical protein